MRRNRATILFRFCVATAAAVALVFAVTPAASASSGTLMISGNTTLTEDHYGNILINSDNVTLDCAGHTVFGPGATGFSGGIEIFGPHTGVTVKRCAVTGFNVNGIFGGGGASNSRYEDNILYSNGNHGMHLDSGTGYVVVGNTSRSNGAIGIVLTGATMSSIMHNTVHDNINWAGIALSAGSHDNVVVNNTAFRNALGFVLDDAFDNELRSNTANLNIFQGFGLLNASENELLFNTANKNLTGFEICCDSNLNEFHSNVANGNDFQGFEVRNVADGNIFTDNTANVNGGDGFLVLEADSNTFTNNTANVNGGAGFSVFGGSNLNTLTHNRGRRNGFFDAFYDGSGAGNVWTSNKFGTTLGI